MEGSGHVAADGRYLVGFQAVQVGEELQSAPAQLLLLQSQPTHGAHGKSTTLPTKSRPPHRFNVQKRLYLKLKWQDRSQFHQEILFAIVSTI